VPESQLEAVSFGKEKPFATGSSDADQAQNRRVEIRY
jgi:peptidoglycan-associated lipoprotein